MTVITPAVPLSTDRTGSGPIVWELLLRSLRGITRRPSTMIPTVIMPLFLVVTFSGSFGLAGEAFGNGNALSWYAPFAILQGASFAGLNAAMSTATDFEIGFFDRLLLAPLRRGTLLLASVASAALRAFVTTAVVLAFSIAGGVAVPGGVLGLVTLFVAAIGVAVVGSLWGLGLVYRTKSTKIGPVVQMGIFMTIFLSTAQVPISVMTGWLPTIARINPMTNILRLSRAGFVPDQLFPPAGFGVGWSEMWPGLLALAGMTVVFGAFAHRNLARVVP